MVNKSKLLHSQ